MKQLLFINTPAGTKPLSSRTPHERSTILRHVQGNRRRAEVLRNKSTQQPWSGCTSVLAPSKPDPEPNPTNDPDKSHDETTATPLPLPTRHRPLHNASDPFHCTSAGPDAGTHALLHTTFHIAARSNFLAEAFAPPATCLSSPSTRHRHHRIFASRLRQCVHDPALMYATLAYGSAFLGWTIGGLPPTLETKSTDYFLGRAVRAVRARLNHGQTPYGGGRSEMEWLLLSIHALSLTEMWLGMPNLWIRQTERHAVVVRESETRLATCRIHLEALLGAAREWGGWEVFDGYLLDSVVLLDKYLAVFCLSRPVVVGAWDPGPVRSCGLDLVGGVDGITWEGVLPMLGTGFEGKITGHELKETVDGIVEYCRVADVVWAKGEVGLATEQWLFRRLQALIHRLLHLFQDLPSLVDRCVCLTGVIFLHTCISHDGPQRSARVAAQHLRRLLTAEAGLERPDEEFPLDKSLLIWCLVIGSMVPGPSLDKTWFVMKLGERQAGRRDELVEELENFFFLPQRQLVAFNEMMDGMPLGCCRRDF